MGRQRPATRRVELTQSSRRPPALHSLARGNSTLLRLTLPSARAQPRTLNPTHERQPVCPVIARPVATTSARQSQNRGASRNYSGVLRLSIVAMLILVFAAKMSLSAGS